jgi:hypothetical protein
MSGRWTILVLALLPGFGSPAAAQDEPPTITREEVRTWTFERDGQVWAVHPASPTSMGDTGLFRLVGSASTLPRGLFSFSVFRDNVERDPKGIDFAVHGFTVGYGVTDRLEVFGAIGVENRVKAHYLDEPGGPNELPFVAGSWATGFGDVRVGAKYGLTSGTPGHRVGLGVRAFFKIPTADPDKGLGTGTSTFGGDVLLSKTLGAGVDLHAVLGYEVNGNPDPPDARETELLADSLVNPEFVANAIRWGVGLDVTVARGAQLEAELSGRIHGDTTVEQTNTVDLIVGASFWLKPGLFIRPSYVYALGYDGRGREVSAGRRSGFNIALGFHGGTRCCQVRPTAAPSK